MWSLIHKSVNRASWGICRDHNCQNNITIRNWDFQHHFSIEIGSIMSLLLISSQPQLMKQGYDDDEESNIRPTPNANPHCSCCGPYFECSISPKQLWLNDLVISTKKKRKGSRHLIWLTESLDQMPHWFSTSHLIVKATPPVEIEEKGDMGRDWISVWKLKLTKK